jgi:Protein kinase domain
MAGLSSGALFAGYVVEDELSRGGMGVVYRAMELRPERSIALKVIAPELAAEAQFRTRFLRESQLAATIEHPHVVPVLRVGEEGGRLFIAMRLIRGRDLAAIIAVEQRLEPVRIARLVDQIADALDTAHAMGLVHRDVKPANILVESHRRGEHAYLTDFGLTKALGSSTGVTSTGVVVGTVDYMAPEQLQGGPLDARTDVYSLGCVLFQGLTGAVPYPMEHRAARMFAHLNAAPPTVTGLVSDAPPQFDEVVGRALAKNPDDRYPSAGDLARAAVAAAERRTQIAVTERSVGAGDAAPATAMHEATTRVQLQPVAAADSGTRRRLLVGGVGVAVVALIVAVIAVVVPSHGQASAARVADRWLGLHEDGNDGQAAALWHAPVDYVEAFPAVQRHFATVDEVRRYWSGRPCKLTLIHTTPQGSGVAVLRVLANGERYGGSSKCSSDGTYYDDRFTVKSGHIVAVQSVLAPVSAASTWLRLHDHGSDETASGLWARSSSVTTVDPAKTYELTGAASVASFWSSRGCDLKPQAAPSAPGASQVALRVQANAQRPHIAQTCNNIGTSYVLHFTFSGGQITKLIFTTPG